MEPHIQTFGGYGYPKKHDAVHPIDIGSTVMIRGVPAILTSLERSGAPRTENGLTTLPDFICRFEPCGVPNGVHPMCKAMSETQLKYVTLTHDGSNATFSLGEYPKYDVGGPLTDMMRIAESCVPIPPCQKCGCEPMLRVEYRGMKNKRCWMQCTGCKNRTVVRSVEILAISDWSQGDMWSEPPQAHAGRYFPKEIADAINAGKHVESSATPSAAVGASKAECSLCNGDGGRFDPVCDQWYTCVRCASTGKEPSNSKPTNCHNPESEDTLPRGNDVPASYKPFQLEYGKRYLRRDGKISGPLEITSSISSYRESHPFCDPNNGYPYQLDGSYWIRDSADAVDLIAEYHEPKPSPSESEVISLRRELDAAVEYHANYISKIDKALGQPRHGGDLLTEHLREIERLTYLPPTASTPAESPEDWVALRDPEHVIRECDWLNHKTGDRWNKCQMTAGYKIHNYPNYKFRCRRKDQPAESPDDWVIQDRVPARPGIDRCWLSLPGNEPSDNMALWWDSDCDENAVGKMHGDASGNPGWVLNVRCRRKDLPVVPADKPKTRTVTLREYRLPGDTAYEWTTSKAVLDMTTGRTSVVEVPE